MKKYQKICKKKINHLLQVALDDGRRWRSVLDSSVILLLFFFVLGEKITLKATV